MSAPLRQETQTLRWNLPARISHWGFSVTFCLALFFAYAYEPESEPFTYHILASVLCCWFLLVRIYLGFFGSHPMRWRAFFHPPKAIVSYLVHALSGHRMEYSGLNPGSSVFALFVYSGLVLLIYSGIVPDLSETWHGRLAAFSLGAIGTHILGLVLHALRHRALTPLAMLHGKSPQTTGTPVVNANSSGGLILLFLSAAVATALIKYFDPSTSTLRVPFLPEIGFPVIQKG